MEEKHFFYQCLLRGTLYLWCLSFATLFGQSGSRLFLIDFEGFPEDTQINNQYASSGAFFSMDADPNNSFPIIAVEGNPTRAFTGGGADNPMSSGSAGLTDPMVDNDPFFGQDIRIDFDPPVTSVRLFIIDIDGSDVMTLRATDDGIEVDSMTISAGQAGAGNGVSTEFVVAAEEIDRVVIDVPNTPSAGYGVDFLTFTRPCAGQECGSLIEIAQESVPGRGDFDLNILGNVLPFPTELSAAQFYAYDIPEGDSWNGPSLSPQAERSHLLLADTTEGLSLVIVHDRAIPNDANGGRAEMSFEIFGDPNGLFRSVLDDPPGTEAGAGYTGDPGASLFTSAHSWNTCCTDGLVLSDIDGDWTMILQFTEVDGNGNTAPIQGLLDWHAISADGAEILLALETDRRVRLKPVGRDVPCDFNGDQTVNYVDLDALAGNWLEQPCPGFEGCNGTDIAWDGQVNLVDYAVCSAFWLTAP